MGWMLQKTTDLKKKKKKKALYTLNFYLSNLFPINTDLIQTKVFYSWKKWFIFAFNWQSNSVILYRAYVKAVSSILWLSPTAKDSNDLTM